MWGGVEKRGWKMEKGIDVAYVLCGYVEVGGAGCVGLLGLAWGGVG